jgi:hypothetical protein
MRLEVELIDGSGAGPAADLAILDKADVNWNLAQAASKHSFPFLGILIAVLPLLLPGLVADRTGPATFLAAATRSWPVAAFGIYLLSDIRSTHTFGCATVYEVE